MIANVKLLYIIVAKKSINYKPKTGLVEQGNNFPVCKCFS